MSMLSSQADRLRAWASQLGERDDLGPVRFAVASDLREAARTILELRDMAQEAQAENARLRKELDAVGVAAYLHGKEQLEAENAKLRELVVGLEDCRHTYCGDCVRWDHGEGCSLDGVMRGLGMEVD